MEYANQDFWMVEKEEAHKIGMEMRGGKGFEESWIGKGTGRLG